MLSEKPEIEQKHFQIESECCLKSCVSQEKLFDISEITYFIITSCNKKWFGITKYFTV